MVQIAPITSKRAYPKVLLSVFGFRESQIENKESKNPPTSEN